MKKPNAILKCRKRLGLSQEAFAARLGLKSKSHVCELEGGKRPSVRVALALEMISGGELKAAKLNPDVALVLKHVAANDASAQERAA